MEPTLERLKLEIITKIIQKLEKLRMRYKWFNKKNRL